LFLEDALLLNAKVVLMALLAAGPHKEMLALLLLMLAVALTSKMLALLEAVACAKESALVLSVSVLNAFLIPMLDCAQTSD
jgi:hypothetical protein